MQVGDDAEARELFDGLVGRPVLADIDRIVGEDIDHGESHEGGEPQRGTEVVAEDKEGGHVGRYPTVECEAVRDGGHAVLANAEADHAPAMAGRRVVAARDLGDVGSGEVCRAAHEAGPGCRHRLEGSSRGVARRHLVPLLEGGEVEGLHALACQRCVKLGRQGGVLLLPGRELQFPGCVDAGFFGAALLEICITRRGATQNFASAGMPSPALALAISSEPRGAPWAEEVPCFVGAPFPITDLRMTSLGFAVSAFASARRRSRPARSYMSPERTFQP